MATQLNITAQVKSVRVTDETITVVLDDGHSVSFPTSWYPRLKHGTPAERNNWRLIGDGDGIHWPDLDEDLSVEGFLAGRKSMESPSSLKKWLADRSATDRKKRRKTA